MKLYTINEIAELVGVHKETVKSWVGSGELGSINVSKSRTSRSVVRRISEKALADFLKARETPSSIVAKRPARNFGAVKQYVTVPSSDALKGGA